MADASYVIIAATMQPAGHAAALLLLCVLAACGDRRPPPPQMPPPSGVETINGRERIGWTQQVPDLIDLGAVRYAIYVDGARRVLDAATCATTAGAAGYDCSAPLPTLTAGSHVLELASFTSSGSDLLESARSSPLPVTVVASVTA